MAASPTTKIAGKTSTAAAKGGFWLHRWSFSVMKRNSMQLADSFYFAIDFRRSQTLSPVRHYNTLTAAREPKFVTVKRTMEQIVPKPYKVNITKRWQIQAAYLCASSFVWWLRVFFDKKSFLPPSNHNTHKNCEHSRTNMWKAIHSTITIERHLTHDRITKSSQRLITRHAGTCP